MEPVLVRALTNSVGVPVDTLGQLGPALGDYSLVRWYFYVPSTQAVQTITIPMEPAEISWAVQA